jgi:putative hydrolase of the HAD superfamily
LHETGAIRGLILDMDDTLYPEHDYFLSGIRVVIAFASRRLAVPKSALQREVDALLAEPEGRSKLFNRLLRRLDAESAGLAATLVQVYRAHKPRLNTFPDVIPTLSLLHEAGCPLGLVTDGPATVQRRKFESLKVARYFDALVFTDDLPPGCHKPSTVPFMVAAELLGVPARECAYFADDPAKDFIGPRELGMRTARIQRPLAHSLQAGSAFPESHQAHEVFASLEAAADGLWPELRRLTPRAAQDTGFSPSPTQSMCRKHQP